MMGINNLYFRLINEKVSSAPLGVTRIIFGLLMLYSSLRFVFNGWIEKLYIQPSFYFKYYGFEWVADLGEYTYLAYGLLILLSVFIIFGLFYRISIISFFLIFTYIELIDKSLYLNHYYFVSIFAFALIFLPAGRIFSLDNKIKKKESISDINAWEVNILKFLLCVVYFYAGLAKLNYDWLFRAMPLSLWLPANSNLPLVGNLLTYKTTAYIFSWVGAFYDLFIWIFLLNKLTRPFAYVAVIIFHMSTALLFQIGVFPYVMTALTLIFFSDNFHISILKLLGWKDINITNGYKRIETPLAIKIMMTVFVLFQLIWPLRFLQYGNNLFWHEQGYRFGWRVMLMEKAGNCTFTVQDSITKEIVQVYPSDYLTINQEKQMSTQPDMILQFAHFLKKEFAEKDWNDPIVKAQTYVVLNGSKGKPLINPNVDLTKYTDGFSSKTWITDF
jgi:hypothetical protein